jgi:sugar O-acyltransferase (sialic acid O-acetyltransferase NeuD family)
MRVIGLGAGGHAKVVIEILRLGAEFEIVGLLDTNEALRGTEVLGVPVLGGDDLMPELFAQGTHHAFLGLGTVGKPGPRRRLCEEAQRHGYRMVPAIHPQAVISMSAQFGVGPTVMAGAVINASARLGDLVIVNTGAVVEHDCLLGDHVHIAPGATLAGGVEVGEGAHVGLGACVREGLRIGRGAIVGAGAVVIEDVPDGVVVAGVPARVLREVRR